MLLKLGPDAPLVTANITHAKPPVTPLHHAKSFMVFVFCADNVILEARKQSAIITGNRLKEKISKVSIHTIRKV